MSTNKSEAAVKKGAALLDSKKKNWALRVCVPELNMESGTHCILGYVYGPDGRAEGVFKNEDGEVGYDVGMKKLFPMKEKDDYDGSVYHTADYERNAEFGFDGRSTLRKFWLIEIGKRLAALAR